VRRWLSMFLLLASVPLLAKEKKPIGDVLERDIFLGTRTYCVDTRGLSSGEASDVRRFLDVESRPKKLLSKIPWQPVPDCREVDAIVKVEFSQQVEIQQATQGLGGLAGAPMSSVPVTKFRASMQIFDRVSQKLVYQVRAQGASVRRDQAISGPFSLLVNDLQALSGARTK